jgi:hypothetical protein
MSNWALRHYGGWRSALRITAPLVTLPVFLYLALPQYSGLQRLLGWLIFSIGTGPGLRYFANPKGIPLIELVGLQYAIAFGLSVFFESEVRVMGGIMLRPEARAVTVAQLSALLAIAFIIGGYALARRLIRLRAPIIPKDPSKDRLLAYGTFVVVSSIAVSLVAGLSVGALGPMEVVLPRTLGLAVLATMYFGGTPTRRERFIIGGLFIGSLLYGLIAGMMQLLLEPLVIWAVARWRFRRKAPIGFGMAILALALILQPIKGYYRTFMGAGGRSFSPAEAVATYALLARDYWSAIGKSDAVAAQGQASVAQRFSLLQSTAHYIQLTPSEHAYKGPLTLLYPIYGLVPRVLWPDKPSAQQANRVLPIEYGIQVPEGIALNQTIFAVGHVAEVYTALGFAGIMPVFFILGLLYAIPQIALGTPRGDNVLAPTAVLLWLAVNMMYIESTIGNAFGGLIQQLIVQSVIFRVLASGERRRSPHLTVAHVHPRH